jgi:FSR family fosmidomycin resistance protein-like MFS transporter
MGRQTVMVGSLLLTALPIVAVLQFQPGSLSFFLAAGLAGVLIYLSNPVSVVVAQDLTPESPAAASGTVLGVSHAIAGAIYIGLGKLQEVIGLTEGMTLGFLMVIPAAALAVVLFLRHPEARA